MGDEGDRSGTRILHLVTRSHRRGAEVVAQELAVALDVLGHHNEVCAIAHAADGHEVPYLPALVQSSRLGITTYVLAVWRLRRLLVRRPADVVLAHGGSAALVVALAVPARTAVRVWQRILGFPLDRWGMARQRMWRAVTRRFDGIVVLTPEMETEVRSLGFEGPVWQLPNTRNPERFSSVDRCIAAKELRLEIGVDADVPVLAFVGHLVEQKQAELSIDVVADLHRRGSRVHLVIAGDGPCRRTVERRIEALDMGAAVTMLGHRDDPEVIFGGADLALITSRSEGIPGVAIEAQMTGCPVVTFLVGGVEDVVLDGVTGVIVPWPEPLLMAEKIYHLLEDEKALAAMSVVAIDRASAFTTARAAALYAETFDELREQREQVPNAERALPLPAAEAS